MDTLLEWAQPWIARGFQPRANRRLPHWPYGCPPPAPDSPPLVIVFCPTFVAHDNEPNQLTAIGGVVEQLVTLSSRALEHSYCLVVGIQHGAFRAGEATNRLERIVRQFRIPGLPIYGFTLEAQGKTLSLNVALQAARAASAVAMVQVDDDVYLEADCLANLLREYHALRRQAVVGATKVPIARQLRTSRLLRWLRAQTGHSCDYPHGCCLAFDPFFLPPRIPDQFVSDDGFICFSSIQPDQPDPMWRLRLVASARCRYFVGGTPWQSARRIRRLLLNAHLLMAGFPAATARYYFRHLLFKGLWPIGYSTGRVGPGSVCRWLLRFVYFWIFVGIGTELALRGIAGRPLREIPWAGVRHRDVPVPVTANGTRRE